MQNAIIAIFCHVDDFLKAISWKDDPQSTLSLAEIITIALTASRFFGSNIESARLFLSEHKYLPRILSKSRLNRRLHAIPAFFWHLIVEHLCAKENGNCSTFLIDSFPIAVCHNVRSSRRNLFKSRTHVGFNASKNTWYTGLKVHILATHHGQPKEFIFTPASEHDLSAFKKMYLGTLSRGATIFGDKAYTSESYESELLEKGILILAERRANSRRGQSTIYHRYGKKIRKRIETSFSSLISWFPRKIHAVSEKGFQLKLMLLITAFSLSFLG